MDKRTVRTWAEINLNALENNLRVAQRKTGKKVMCVIKGDAHGHGAVACGRALEAAGADAFGVAALTEAVELRQSGSRLPILILGWTPPEYVGEIIENGLTQSVMDDDYAAELSRTVSNKGAYAVINGKRCPQIGRICMDMCMFDVSDADVKQGDEAILYGAGGMSMEELTNLVGTINCEPTCLLTKRVQRVYVRK